MSIRLLPLLLMLLLAAAVGCSEQEEPTVVLDEANLTVEEVYARFAEAINRPGFVYYLTIDVDDDGAPWAMEGTRELWTDPSGDRARHELDMLVHFDEDARYQTKVVLIDGAAYSHTLSPDISDQFSKTRTAPCDFGSAAACLAVEYLGLGYLPTTANPNEDWVEEIHSGRYHGRSAIIITSAGTTKGEIGTSTFTVRLYIDMRTSLPIALEGEGTFDYGQEGQGNWLYTYKSEFVPADSLPDDFFDPASIGYVEHDPEEPLQGQDLGITVYWLGRRFEADGGLPPLALKQARLADPEKGPGYSLTLDYRLADDEFDPITLTLEEWDIDKWNASNTGIIRTSPDAPPVTVGKWWERPCWERKDIELPAGHATIILGFEHETQEKQPTIAAGERGCPSSPHDRFWALAYLGSTVLEIDAPSSDSLYDTLEGMEAVVKGLHPRE